MNSKEFQGIPASGKALKLRQHQQPQQFGMSWFPEEFPGLWVRAGASVQEQELAPHPLENLEYPWAPHPLDNLEYPWAPNPLENLEYPWAPHPLEKLEYPQWGCWECAHSWRISWRNSHFLNFPAPPDLSLPFPILVVPAVFLIDLCLISFPLFIVLWDNHFPEMGNACEISIITGKMRDLSLKHCWGEKSRVMEWFGLERAEIHIYI